MRPRGLGKTAAGADRARGARWNFEENGRGPDAGVAVSPWGAADAELLGPLEHERCRRITEAVSLALAIRCSCRAGHAGLGMVQREQRHCPRPIRVRAASVSLTSIVRPAPGWCIFSSRIIRNTGHVFSDKLLCSATRCCVQQHIAVSSGTLLCSATHYCVKRHIAVFSDPLLC
eukprot:gene15087-biopygen8142